MTRTHSDKRLVQRMKSGEARAFEEFVDSYGAHILRLTRRYVSNPADCEDLVQEIFFDIYRSIGAFRGDSALTTYIYRIAVNHCLRHCQRNRSNDLPLQEGDDTADTDWRNRPEDSAVKSELKTQVQTALSTLPDLQRDVVILHELHGLTYQECAEVLEVPVGTVKSRLSGGFRRLRDSLRSYVLGDGASASSLAVSLGKQGTNGATEEVSR
ncbi:RNA polymerase sigma factor RpoE [Armatimonadota bacterium]|nr:RNA polymerase sigma factor RpoE [Armatimonadota bacterium]